MASFVEFEQWAKNSLIGIILLGAIGSLVGIFILRITITFIKRVLPVPLKALRKQSSRNAFVMGFVHATIANDETHRLLPALIAYRLARFVAALTAFLFAMMIACYVFILQAHVSLTAGTFFSVVIAFMSIYWASFEFEWIYRTYRWLWSSTIERAQKSYLARLSPSSSASSEWKEANREVRTGVSQTNVAAESTAESRENKGIEGGGET